MPGVGGRGSSHGIAGEAVRLRDGSQAIVRPIAPEDKERLAAAFERLSDLSRYRRFLAAKPRLSGRDLAFLTEVDHRDHEALVATDPTGAEALGISRYVRLPDEREVAEAAVTVIDEWQGRGLGAVLLDRLTERAREEGIRRFRAEVLLENRRAIELFRQLGTEVEVTGEHATARLEAPLPPEPAAGAAASPQLAGTLRFAAAGHALLDSRWWFGLVGAAAVRTTVRRRDPES
jgi:GNAT superfamily N-acetyltransferase